MPISDEQYHDLLNRFRDKHWRMNNLYWIKDKNGKKIRFRFNEVQANYEKNKHNRNLILKARQQGFTTYECINALDNCLFNSYYDAGIIAHTVDDAEKIFTNKIKFAFESLPEAIKQIRKPNTDRAGELRFPNGSSISVSAGFRGGTLMKLHVSEYGKICAKYPEKAREIRTGAFNAVPLDGDLTVESTAEGMNGDFYELCDIAQGKNNSKLTGLDFKFHFFAWWQSKEYQLNPNGILISKEMEDYFKSLEVNHGINLTAAQKAWYSKKEEEQGDDMKQEYPSFPEEAFRASGRPVFNLEKLARDIKRVKDKTFTEAFIDVLGHDKKNHRVTYKIFHNPKPEDACAIGADVAEGLENGDSSTASILNKDFKQLASFEGKLDPDIFGKFLVELGKKFNHAVLAPEINNHGHATLAAIKNAQYYKIYQREIKEELAQEITDKIGWHTNVKTKMQMIDDLKAVYRDDLIEINCVDTLREMMSLTIEDNGDIVLNSKDKVVALAIAIQATRQAVLPASIGTFDSASGKTVFKTLHEMLKHSGEAEESYFD